MTALREAYELAQERSRSWTDPDPEDMEMSADDIAYAYRRCEITATMFYPRSSISNEDLVHIGMLAILEKVKAGKTGVTWMGNVAKWAMADELNRVFGRRGKTRQGKDRTIRYVTELMPEDSVADPDYDLPVALEQATAMLTYKQRQIVKLMAMGYKNREIASILGVSDAAITLRRQSVAEAWRGMGF